MAESIIDVDYLIVGAGAAGMVFADSLLTETDATIAIVDRHDRPGGHWNHAYPFVRLHQPAAMYGVGSRPLGSGAKDNVGLNAGMYELASGQEVLSHFDLVMRQRFLPSGRVRFLPMSEANEQGSVVSLLSGQRTTIRAGKIVDASHSAVSVPSTHVRPFAVAPDVTCVPPNALPRIARAHEAYVVIGAGKTGIDTCIWLLENGADPSTIRWIMPRDPWLLNRARYQPGAEFFAHAAKSLADQVDILAHANSVAEVMARLEEVGDLRRIDESVVPEAYHCATVSDAELAQLRRIRNIVRLGRVTQIDADQVLLKGGVIPTSTGTLHIDCSAIGLPWLPTKPVFDGERITLQFVRLCQPTFSAALIGFVEAMGVDDAEKNRICRPLPPPHVPADWVRMMEVELANRHAWSKSSQIQKWIRQSRLDGFSKQLQALGESDPTVIAQLRRYAEHVAAAAANVTRILPA